MTRCSILCPIAVLSSLTICFVSCVLQVRFFPCLSGIKEVKVTYKVSDKVIQDQGQSKVNVRFGPGLR